MQHLTREALARLVDETPNHEERRHLDGCGACRAELAALQEQTSLLASLPPLTAPARGWPLLEAQLQQEGLVRSTRFRRPLTGSGPRGLLRAATYIGLFLLGGASGTLLMRGSGPSAGGMASAGPQWQPVALEAETAEEAAAVLREAEALYLDALGRYGQLTGAPRMGSDPAARLAALEGIVLTTRAALEAAPADPVINGYYLTAIGQRDAVLRQIARGPDDPWF
jgi:hypothetical protein